MKGKDKKVEIVEEKVDDVQVAAVLAAVHNDGKTEFSVYDADGRYVRVYTLDIHGKEAKQLANQFALKIKGEVK